MKRYPALFACACLALGASVAAAQTAPATTPAAAPAESPVDKEVVTLPTFTITEEPANPYISKQALSSSRVAMEIQDIPQTVSVVTSEFMKDTLSLRMLDAAKYVTPITESTLPTGGDRYTIRGFQVSHEFVDGMEISGADGYSASLMSYNIDRISLTLEDVARHCGYASSSHFCREYRAVHHFTPTYWRKKLIDRFVKPLPPGTTFTRNFSARPQERIMPA